MLRNPDRGLSVKHAIALIGAAYILGSAAQAWLDSRSEAREDNREQISAPPPLVLENPRGSALAQPRKYERAEEFQLWRDSLGPEARVDLYGCVPSCMGEAHRKGVLVRYLPTTYTDDTKPYLLMGKSKVFWKLEIEVISFTPKGVKREIWAVDPGVSDGAIYTGFSAVQIDDEDIINRLGENQTDFVPLGEIKLSKPHRKI